MGTRKKTASASTPADGTLRFEVGSQRRWAPYPAGRVSDDVLVLRVLREILSDLKDAWPEDEGPPMVDGGVVELELEEFGLTGAVPAEVGRLTALRVLILPVNQLTSVPAEIGQLTSLEERNSTAIG